MHLAIFLQKYSINLKTSLFIRANAYICYDAQDHQFIQRRSKHSEMIVRMLFLVCLVYLNCNFLWIAAVVFMIDSTLSYLYFNLLWESWVGVENKIYLRFLAFLITNVIKSVLKYKKKNMANIRLIFRLIIGVSVINNSSNQMLNGGKHFNSVILPCYFYNSGASFLNL